jgi:hypothetical protein
VRYLVQCQVDVEIEIDDSTTAITRCTENHNDEGEPMPDERGSRGWRNMFYDLEEEEDVLRHLAFNAVANGVSYASRLDGWADLQPDDVTMQVDRRSFDAVFITPL